MDEKKADGSAGDKEEVHIGGGKDGDPGPHPDTGYLMTYTRHVERRNRALETEKSLLDVERVRLGRELQSLRNELDRLSQPPLLVAKVKRALPDGRVIVSDGIRDYLVKSVAMIHDRLKPGMAVALNQRTFAVVEVVPDSDESKTI